ncbi:MAG: biotin--[acetyl-CoA-carboxylase] ligase [Elusimicrobia bacterium]|nr:biotin--[acetyl-CoA-carboxylase] ligase [Elusimicrobiota bacterium]
MIVKKLNTKYFGKNIIWFSEIDSTQDYAKKIAKKSVTGTIIVSEKQLNGRGQFERGWDSGKGGLYFSIILKPVILDKPQKIQLLTYKMALAIIDVFKNTCSVTRMKNKRYSCFIKPPNDIMIKIDTGKVKKEHKKIAGILTESSISKSNAEWVVIGVGININNKIPKSLKNIAISMKEITRKKWTIINILNRIIKNFENYHFRFTDKEIFEKYKKYCKS